MKTSKEMFILHRVVMRGAFLGSENSGSNDPRRIPAWGPAVGTMYLTHELKSSQSLELLLCLFPFTEKGAKTREARLAPGCTCRKGHQQYLNYQSAWLQSLHLLFFPMLWHSPSTASPRPEKMVSPLTPSPK